LNSGDDSSASLVESDCGFSILNKNNMNYKKKNPEDTLLPTKKNKERNYRT
jgi:hypothetical protein